ncbi:hypothetical protein BASA83_004745 [Batrachochytrium salamandrivorans]|nr:hypothetical protein BASA83_004745 [Batrachochytrium salamandrivorans]
MKLSAIALSMYLIGAVSVSSYPIGGSESESKSPNTNRKLLKWSRPKGKVEDSKGGLLKPTETTKSSSTWYTDSDDDQPKPLEDLPTQKQNNRDIKNSRKRGNPDLSGPTGLDMSISTESHQTTKKKKYTFGRTKGGLLEPTETTKSSSTWYTDSDDDQPKPLEDLPTQKQNNRDIKNSRKRGNPDLSGPSGLDMSISTESHQTTKKKKYTFGRTKGGLLEPKESTKSLSAQYTDSDDDQPKPLEVPKSKNRIKRLLKLQKRDPAVIHQVPQA